MRTYCLVLLVATSALASPILVEQAPLSNAVALVDNGKPVNSAVIDTALTLVDAADSNVYVNALQQLFNVMADQPDSRTQGIAVMQCLGILGYLTNGYPGDSCAASIAVNDYAAGGTAASFRSILAGYLDNILEVLSNPNARRYASSPSGGCAGDGTVYQFEEAWNRILASTSAKSLPILNEEYCAAKRLYNANSIQSRNVASIATACAAVADEGCDYHSVNTMLRAIAFGGDYASAAAVAKAALLS